MRRDVFNKLMTLPMGYFDRNQAGDIISRVSYDVDVVCTSLSTDAIQIVTSTVTVAGSFAMMCAISVPLVLCMAATIPVSILYTRYMSKKTRPLYSKRSAAYGAMNGYAEEMFSGQRTILAYAQEDRVCGDFSEINRNAAEAYRNADGMGMTMGPTMGMISNFGLAAIGMGGAILYMLGVVGLKQISSFVLYSRKFFGPINEISNIINEIFSALAASERVFRLLDEPEEVKDIYGAAELTGCRGDVRAEGVSFGYNPGKTILHGLEFEVKPGQTVAIVGPTGAGKTTIINLLMRFYDPEGGCIMRLPQGYHTASPRTAATSPRGRSSCSPSPGPCCTTPVCSSWTRPPPTWTPTPSARCRRPSAPSWWAGPASSSPTGCPPSRTPTTSWWWTTAAWWSRAPTRRSCSRRGFTTGCTPASSGKLT